MASPTDKLTSTQFSVPEITAIVVMSLLSWACGVHGVVGASETHRMTTLTALPFVKEEAAAVGTYVAAHAYMPSAITRAVQCGVRRCELTGLILGRLCGVFIL